MSQLTRSRRDVESRLAHRESRINGTISRLKNDLSVPGVSIPSVVKGRPYQSALGVLAIGVAAGVVYSIWGMNRSSDNKIGGMGAVADAYSELLAARIAGYVAEGLTPEEALRRAVRANPPVVVSGSIGTPSPPSGGIVQQLIDRLALSISNMVVAFATEWIENNLRHSKSAK